MRWLICLGLCLILGCGAEGETTGTDPGTTDSASADAAADSQTDDIPTPDIPTPDDTPTPDNSNTSATNINAMIAIHLDPTGPMVTHATEENWQRLSALVSRADEIGHKLTLLMSSDWAELTQAAPGRKLALKEWVTNGHQLGYHHHTCDHTSPDGYRDLPGLHCKNADDRGSVATSFTVVRDLGASLPGGTKATVNIAAQGPNTDGIFRAAEWQPDAIYATGEMGENGDGHNHRFITLPRCVTSYGNSYSGSQTTYQVAELGHAQLDVGDFRTKKSDNNLEALSADIDLALAAEHADTGVHIGVVFHGREYYPAPRDDSYGDDQVYLDAVFQLFVDKGVQVLTAGQILTIATPCAE